MRKKIQIFILCLLLSISSTFPALASSTTWSTGRQVFPSWVDFQTMEEKALAYGYDSYFIYFAAGGTQTDGSATYNYVLYNSPESLYYSSGKIYNSSSKFYVYCYNVDSGEFEYYKYFTSITIAAGDELYFSDDIYDQSGNLVYSAGPSDTYLDVLADDEDYQEYVGGGSGGDDTTDGEDLSNGGLLSGIKSALSSLGSRLSSKLDELVNLLSYPVDYVTETVTEFMSNFAFIENIAIFGDLFMDFLNSDFSECPVIEIDLSNDLSTSYDYGDTAVALDLSFYGRPFSNGVCLKDIGDPLIGSFLWLSFLWNLYSGLPTLISGGAMQVLHPSEMHEAATYRRDVYQAQKQRFYRRRGRR